MKSNEYYQKIYEKNDQLNQVVSSYWHQYSDFDTWKFWLAVVLLIAPLILLYFKVDRKRVFEVLFFGYTVHLLWTYFDIILEKHNYFFHTYFITPILPLALDVTGSVLPVGFLLLYQYCTNRNKSYYLYVLVLSAVFAFGFASIEKLFGLAEFRKGLNQIHLFLIDIGIAYVAYWFNKALLQFRR